MLSLSVLLILIVTTTMVNGQLSSNAKFPEHLTIFTKAMDDIYHGRGGMREERCDFSYHHRDCNTVQTTAIRHCCRHFGHAIGGGDSCLQGRAWCGTTKRVAALMFMLGELKLI